MNTTKQPSAIEIIDAVIAQTLQRGGCPGYGTLMQLREDVSTLSRAAGDALAVLEAKAGPLEQETPRRLREALAQVDAPALPGPMRQLAEHLAAVRALLTLPEVAAEVGDGLAREIGYALVSFRTRFASRFEGAQATLL